MVKYEVAHRANANRVYATGQSCGAMFTEALLAVYPDVFKGGSEFSGVPVGGCWTCSGGYVDQTPQQWGAIVDATYPGYAGYRPRVQLWPESAPEPEPLLDVLPDELPSELFWAPELEPAVASLDPPSSPAGIELPDELPAPVEAPRVDDDPHAAIDDGTLANPRSIQETRQFMEGSDLGLAEALVSTQGFIFRSAYADSRPAALTIVWASAGKVIPLKLTLPITTFPGPLRLGLALVAPTQLFVYVRCPVLFDEFQFAVA